MLPTRVLHLPPAIWIGLAAMFVLGVWMFWKELSSRGDYVKPVKFITAVFLIVIPVVTFLKWLTPDGGFLKF